MLKDQNMELDTEHRIMEAASQVFMQKGRLGASMQDIADEAGINRTLLHYYFRNKEKLFDTIFESIISKIFPAMVQALSSELPLQEKIEIFTESYSNLLKENPFLPVFVLQEISLNPDRMAKRIENLGIKPEKAIMALSKEITDAGIEDMDTRHLFAHILGMLIFPYMARPLFQLIAFQNNSEAYDKFLEERKEQIPGFMKMALAPKT
jgi:TetR/AcrR family transcriptional regulator